ncbi:hypothetical protein HC891_11775 [Candidatus Gracilibacteria bacterium]|nr:hypothetical protein [Candidatus Gracilibacteria bacterium]
MHDIITTKIRPPATRAALVQRARLNTLLQHGLELPLTLVVAPAGFGKTTLVTELVGQLPPGQLAWLACDSADNELLRFWRYLLSACESARPGLATAALALLHAPNPVFEMVVGALINALVDATEPLVVVLDDYHLIENQAVHTALTLLIDHQRSCYGCGSPAAACRPSPWRDCERAASCWRSMPTCCALRQLKRSSFFTIRWAGVLRQS